MCGIFGYVSWNTQNNILDEQKLINATNLLSHRGPDAGAYFLESPFFLAHRRLSIIDIKNGEQPLFSKDERYVLSFNGEIYNFIELKKELADLGHNFFTTSDTEVIINGYIQWGEKVCEKIIGMFSFAIYDRKEKTFFLARDRIGEKPLFYFFENNIFSFASEIKSLAYIADFSLNINSNAFEQYLCLNYVPGNSTLLNKLHKLKPGCWMHVSLKGIKIESYWHPKVVSSVENLSINEAIDQLDNHLIQSVKIGSRSEVPITLALSGGIDSSLVGYYAAMQGSLTEAYCVDFQDQNFSEFGQAKLVANKLGVKINPIPFSSKNLESFLDTVYHSDDPLADSSSLAVWVLAKEVSKRYKVMLGGDGGDEIFGGYLTYKATMMYQKIFKYLPSPLRTACYKFKNFIPISDKKVSFNYKLMRFLRAFNLSPEQAHFTWNGSWHPDDAKEIFTSSSDEQINFSSSKLSKLDDKNNLLNLQLIDIENYLPSDILTKVDRMTMAHGLESRSPLLHPDIVNFGLSLPFSYKISQSGKSKFILRELVERKIGKSISQAKKQGFSLPINQWLRKDAKTLLLDILSSQQLDSIPFLNKNFIQEAIKSHIEGRKENGFELWGLMVFVTWYKQKILEPYYIISHNTLKKLKPLNQKVD
ncbi:MAG: asparagine synthase (glutamine-hydrolyzing) [Janthinobacterium lividum]